MEEKREETIKKIKKYAKEAYVNQGRNYKQKLIYGLLATLKNNDRNKFLNILYTNLNAMSKDGTQKILVNNLMNEYEYIIGPHFETYAYAIVAGILASNDGRVSQENIQNGEENE